MQKTKIALFSPSLQAVSGVSTHARMLLTSELTRDFDLLHFQVGSEGRCESAWEKLLRYAFSPLQLALFLLRTKTDLVHMNTSLDPKAYWRDLAYLVVAKCLGRRVINQIHGGALPEDFCGGNHFLIALLRICLRWSNIVTVLSSEELAAYRAFETRANIQLVPNAIDPVGLIGQGRTYNTDQPLRLVYLGRLVRSKGLFELIDAVTQLKSAGRKFQLSVAGGGLDQGELIAFVERSGLGGRVKFLGSVFDADKRQLWLASDVFLFPTYAEGLPYALLEAMAAGCVPVTTRVGAIPDVMRDGEHGLFVPARNASALAAAVAALDDDRARMVRMAEAGRQQVANRYTVGRLTDDFRRLYSSLM